MHFHANTSILSIQLLKYKNKEKQPYCTEIFLYSLNLSKEFSQSDISVVFIAELSIYNAFIIS
jgi:hypothetical protein